MDNPGPPAPDNASSEVAALVDSGLTERGSEAEAVGHRIGPSGAEARRSEA